MTIVSAKTPVRYPKILPMRAERNIKPVAVVEKLYGSFVMISETVNGSVYASMCISASQ